MFAMTGLALGWVSISQQTGSSSAGPSFVGACCKTAVPALIPQSSLLSGELFWAEELIAKFPWQKEPGIHPTAIVPRTGKYKLKHFAAAFLFFSEGLYL